MIIKSSSGDPHSVQDIVRARLIISLCDEEFFGRIQDLIASLCCCVALLLLLQLSKYVSSE